jgi:hypothetical protein
MHFTTSLSVIIGGKLIKTVHSVKTKFDSKHIGSTCDIVVPLNTQIEYVNGKHDQLTAYTLSAFKVGDPVSVTASYPNTGFAPVTIFNGTVYEFTEGMPCSIRCIDYQNLLGHMQNITKYTGSLQGLIQKILAGTGVSLILPTVSMQLYQITFREMSPWSILEYIKKNIGLNISLQGTKLYCNVASNTLNTVIYRSDRNIYHCGLQQPDTVWQGYKVKAYFIQPNGVKDSFELGDNDGHMTEVYFYNVPTDLKTYQMLAASALDKCRQRKFSGEVNGYLYPDCQLFDKVQYTDVRYPDRNGNYVITELSHDISDKGFHRQMKWAYLVDFLNEPNA